MISLFYPPFAKADEGLELPKPAILATNSAEQLVSEPIRVGSLTVSIIFRVETLDLQVGNNSPTGTNAVIRNLVPQAVLIQNGSSTRLEAISDGGGGIWNILWGIAEKPWEKILNGFNHFREKGFHFFFKDQPGFQYGKIFLGFAIGIWLVSAIVGFFSSRLLWSAAEMTCKRPFSSIMFGFFLLLISVLACGMLVWSVIGAIVLVILLFPLGMIFVFSIATGGASLVHFIRPPKSLFGAVAGLLFSIPIIIGVSVIPKVGLIVFCGILILSLGAISLSELQGGVKI